MFCCGIIVLVNIYKVCTLNKKVTGAKELNDSSGCLFQAEIFSEESDILRDFALGPDLLLPVPRYLTLLFTGVSRFLFIKQ